MDLRIESGSVEIIDISKVNSTAIINDYTELFIKDFYLDDIAKGDNKIEFEGNKEIILNTSSNIKFNNNIDSDDKFNIILKESLITTNKEQYADIEIHGVWINKCSVLEKDKDISIQTSAGAYIKLSRIE